MAHGDSITIGAYDGVTPYPAQLGTLLKAASKNGIVANFGCNSIGFNQPVLAGSCGAGAVAGSNGTLINNAAALVDPIIKINPLARLVIFGGTNDIWIGGSTGAQTCTFAQTYVAARIAAGWPAGRIIFATMLPRDSNALQETERQSFISCMVTYAGGAGIVLARLDLNANIGVDGAQNNLTYYRSDAIHPNQTGLGVVASVINGVYP